MSSAVSGPARRRSSRGVAHPDGVNDGSPLSPINGACAAGVPSFEASEDAEKVSSTAREVAQVEIGAGLRRQPGLPENARPRQSA